MIILNTQCTGRHYYVTRPTNTLLVRKSGQEVYLRILLLLNSFEQVSEMDGWFTIVILILNVLQVLTCEKRSLLKFKSEGCKKRHTTFIQRVF